LFIGSGRFVEHFCFPHFCFILVVYCKICNLITCADILYVEINVRREVTWILVLKQFSKY